MPYMTTPCQPSSFSAKASLSGCLAFCLKSAKLEAVKTYNFIPTVWWYRNVSRNRAEVEHMSKGLIWISCFFFHLELAARHLWPQLMADQQSINAKTFHIFESKCPSSCEGMSAMNIWRTVNLNPLQLIFTTCDSFSNKSFWRIKTFKSLHFPSSMHLDRFVQGGEKRLAGECWGRSGVGTKSMRRSYVAW